LAKATDTTTRLVWRHGKGTTSSACAGTDDSTVLRVRFLIIAVITKSVTKSCHIEPFSGSVACRERRASTSCIGQREIECDDEDQFPSVSYNNIMSDVLCWIIPFLLFPLTASLTLNPTNYIESILSPRLLLPRNAPYSSRATNASTLNNITTNITSGSQKFIWIIQDNYNASNFFQWVPQSVVRTPFQRASLIRSFSFFTGEDPTQYVLFTSALPELTPSQRNRQVFDYSLFTPLVT